MVSPREHEGHWLLLSLAAVLPLLTACLPSNSYSCETNEQCLTLSSTARCESGGYCSVEDLECRSDRRYADGVGPLSGTCVPSADEIPDAGPVVGPDAQLDGDGSVIDPGGPFLSVAGGNKSFCAVGEAGAVSCWGRALKNPNETHPDKPQPVAVLLNSGAPLVGASAVSVGDDHACAIVAGGKVSCWGHNFTGQLGKDGASRFHAAEVPNFAGAAKIYCHGNTTCALKSDSTLWCWGYGLRGQLGDGQGVTRSTPTRYGGTGLSNVPAAGMGRYHTCAVTPTSELLCAGRNNARQVGNNSTDDALDPVNVVIDGSNTPLTGVIDVSGGTDHTCAIASGGIVCWGTDQGGELGLAVPGVSSFPNAIDLSNVSSCNPVEVRSRNQYGCARCDSGRVVCWGQGEDGQLGNGDYLPSLSAVYVESLEQVTELATASLTACALNNGRVVCWGNDKFGELGDGLPYGDTVITPLPTSVLFD